MSDIHVLSGNGTNQWDLVFHIAVPNANNSVSANYRTALVNSGLGGTTSMKDGDGTLGTISSAEKTSIQAGSVYEHKISFVVESGGLTAGNLQTLIRALYNREETFILAFLQQKLKYFGHTESKS